MTNFRQTSLIIKDFNRRSVEGYKLETIRKVKPSTGRLEETVRKVGFQVPYRK